MSGCVITFLAMAYILLYANNRNPSSIKEILVGMFIQIKLYQLRKQKQNEIAQEDKMNEQKNNSLFRITPKILNTTINSISKYSDKKQYPFIRILPHTKPTNRYILYDSLIFGAKERTKKAMLKPYSAARVTNFRKICDNACEITTPIYPDYTNVKMEQLTDQNIKCYWIQYYGSSIENGVIIGLHGGGYTAGSPAMQYSLCSLLSKLTGCACISIDYRLAPENPLPAAVEDAVAVYKYLLEDLKISPGKITVMGESAGGGLSLLLIQYLNDNNIALPSSCWVNSPWTNLEMKNESWLRNSDYDAILTWDPTKSYSQLNVGNMDIDGNLTGNNNDLKNKIYSPLYGNWKGLCPLYFMVGATEMLIDDTINAAIEAYKVGVNVKVDIEPNMMHTWCLFQRAYVEAHYCAVRAADFILEHLK
eukprot:92964_1